MICGAFLDAFGVLLRHFGASVFSLACWCHPVGCLWLAWAVRGLSLLLFVVPLARLGCLWALSATFYGFWHIQDCFWITLGLV